MRTSIIHIITVPALLLALSGITSAQKLPNVQQKGLRAPANIKTDGKPAEWGGTFQAYNHATEIYYSVANDDQNLYLVVQATDNRIINKIIGGGVQFTIQRSGKKEDKGGVTITYPIFDAKNRPYVRRDAGVKTLSGDAASGISSVMVDGGAGSAGKLEGDSVMNVYNQRLDQNSKTIIVKGIPGVDSLLSVYNEDGIKTGERFNNKMVYTYELAIDLKKLGLSVSEGSKFAYHITLNGAATQVTYNGPAGTTMDPAKQEMLNQLMAQMRAQNSMDPTDVWGEYTLAKN